MRTSIFISVLMISNFLFTPVKAQEQTQVTPPEVPVEAYGALPSKSMMVISPSSERMAYRLVSEGKDAFVVIDLIKKSVIAAVDVSEVNPDNAYFIDDNRLIFVVSKNKRIRGYRGSHEVSVAYSYNIEEAELNQLLIPGYGISAGQTALGSIIGLSLDNKYAYMPAYKNAGSYNLYRVNIDKKRTPTIYRKGTSDTIDFFLNEKSEVIARERYNNEDDLHRVESYITGEWKEIFRQVTPYKTKSFSGVTPDRKSLVMRSQDGEHGRWAYYTMSLEDGTISEPTFSHPDKDVERVITDINRVVHGVQYSGFVPTYEFFNKKLNARMRGLKKALPNNTLVITDQTPDWNAMVFYMDGQYSSGDYVLYKDGALEMLSQARKGIPAEAVNTVTEYNFKARDGLNIPTLITTPVGMEAKNLPAIMMPHGGPESYDRMGFDWMGQYFANQGYLVIQPQFRGSKGFGPEHLWKGRGQWGRKMQDDLTDAVADLAKNGVIDKDHVCIVGSSYGGYAALAGATFTPDLYKCVVSINGVSDVEEMMDEEKKNHGSDHWVVSYWETVISNGEFDDDHLEQISPINHVKNIKAPVLLIHGELDKVVPFEQSDDMYDELKDEDKDVTFVELEKGDHHLSKAKNRMKALKSIDTFIKKHI